MSSQTSVVVQSREQEDFVAFQREFERSVGDLAKAHAESLAAGKEAADISNKGVLKMVWGSWNGKNDKELAQMTGRLATSLNATQTVLQVVMKISHRKNGFLKQFHEVLANKIASLTKDTKTLNHNQRDATLVILQEIETHVSGQLAQQDMVDHHQRQLESINCYIEAADMQSFRFTEQLTLLSANLGELRQSGNSMAARLALEKARGDAFEAIADALRNDLAAAAASLQALGAQARDISQVVETQRSLLDSQRTLIAQQTRRNVELDQALADMQASLAAQGNQIHVVEDSIRRSQAPAMIVLHYAPAFAALLLAGATLLTK